MEESPVVTRPRGIHPPGEGAAQAAELTRPASALDMLVGSAVLFGPLVVALVVPLGALELFHAAGSSHITFSVFGAIIGLGVGGYVGVVNTLLGAFSSSSRASQLRRVPVVALSKPFELPPGELVFVEGRVALGEAGAIEGPLTGRSCVRADVAISVTRPGQQGRTLVDFRHRTLAVPFRVADDEGHFIAVDPEGGKLLGEGRTIQQASRHDETYPAGYDACLAHEGLTLSERQDASISERALRVGERVVALGVLARPLGYRDAAELVLRGDDRDRLVLSTEPLERMIAGEDPWKRRFVAAMGLLVFVFGMACTVAIAARW